jgi:hypothetical protein
MKWKNRPFLAATEQIKELYKLFAKKGTNENTGGTSWQQET